MGFGGISIWQILIILAIVLVIFGGTKRLKNLGPDLGNALKGFKKAIDVLDKKEDSDNKYPLYFLRMFDIGILELFLVLVIGLVVLGPERLPEVVKSVTRSMKWIKKTITSTKEEVSKNIGLDVVYQDLRNEEILKKSETDGLQNKEE